MPNTNDPPNPPSPPPFINPWLTKPKTSLKKNSLVTLTQIEEDLRKVCPKYGVLQTTISILLQKLDDELKRQSITTYAPDVFGVAIAGCSIRLGGIDYPGTTDNTNNNGIQRSPTPGSSPRRKSPRTPKVPKGNDGRGTSDVALEHEGLPDASDSGSAS